MEDYWINKGLNSREKFYKNFWECPYKWDPNSKRFIYENNKRSRKFNVYYSVLLIALFILVVPSASMLLSLNLKSEIVAEPARRLQIVVIIVMLLVHCLGLIGDFSWLVYGADGVETLNQLMDSLKIVQHKKGIV